MFNYKHNHSPNVAAAKDLLYWFFTVAGKHKSKCRFCQFIAGEMDLRTSPYSNKVQEEDYARIKAHVDTHTKVVRCKCGMAFANDGGVQKHKKTLSCALETQERELEKHDMYLVADLQDTVRWTRKLLEKQRIISDLDIKVIHLNDKALQSPHTDGRWFARKEVADAVYILLYRTYQDADVSLLSRTPKFWEDIDLLIQSIRDNNLEAFYSLLELRHL